MHRLLLSFLICVSLVLAESNSNFLCDNCKLGRVLCCLTASNLNPSYSRNANHVCSVSNSNDKVKCNFLNVIGKLTNETNEITLAVFGLERFRKERDNKLFHSTTGHAKNCGLYDSRSLLHSFVGASALLYSRMHHHDRHLLLPSSRSDWSELICDRKNVDPIFDERQTHRGSEFVLNVQQITDFLKNGEFARLLSIVDVLKHLRSSPYYISRRRHGYYGASRRSVMLMSGSSPTIDVGEVWDDITGVVFERYQGCLTEAVEDAAIAVAWSMMATVA